MQSIVRLALCVLGLIGFAASMCAEPPAADPRVVGGSVDWFALNEKPVQVARTLGQPTVIADFGEDFQSWQFKLDSPDPHEFSLLLVFRKSTQTLISVTRNYEPERTVDPLFPDRETTVHHFPDAGKPQFSLRLRRLPGDRVLMAMGSSRQGQACGQLVLVRADELRHFYPWLSAGERKISRR